jgi:5-hydroxyisourate hydrolase
MKKLSLFLGSVLLSPLSMAQNPLSVHVLNLENGLPSPDVNVTLEEQKNGQWVQISQAKTNEQGRITALFPENQAFKNTTYKVTFKTGEWFKKNQ